MIAYLISDNIDTLVGMKLAGIKGTIARDGETVLEEIKKAASDQKTGIILITEKAAAMSRDKINNLKLNMEIPLIVEIPDRHTAVEKSDRITKYIKEAIGLKV